MSLTRDTKNENSGIMMIPNDEYGSYMMLPEYGFGSWLKNNVGGILKGAGSLVKFIPGVGQIAGPILNIAGSVAGGIQDRKNAQSQANQEQKRLDMIAGEQKKANHLQDVSTFNQSFFNNEDNVNYGGVFEYGGDMMMGGMEDEQTQMMNPQIVEYSDRADKHGEGIGGVPVDKRGNPVATSRTAAVGLTEGGEVTWNGYVFSNKLKI